MGSVKGLPIATATWTQERVRLGAFALVFTYLTVGVALTLGNPLTSDQLATSLGGDFLAFHAAGRAVDSHGAAAIYDLAVMTDAIRTVDPSVTVEYGWFYPPSYLLLVHPLTYLPYHEALLIWLAATAALFCVAIRPLIRSSTEALVIAAAPVMPLHMLYGQNAFLTAALIVLAYRCLNDRPRLAGLALGLLTLKPHLGLLWPLPLLVWRRWQVILSAGAMAALLIAVSTGLYGPAAWVAFFTDNFETMHEVTVSGLLPWMQMGSLYVLALSFGLTPEAAMVMQAAFILAVLAGLVELLRRRAAYRLVMAFLIAASIPVSPHSFFYDWVILTLPMLIWWREIEETGFRRLELAVMIAVYWWPCAVLLLPKDSGIATGFLPLLALLVCLFWRAAARPCEPCREPMRHDRGPS